jgi:hypothetical protein
MTGLVRRRPSFSRSLVALGGVALLALLAVAALLLGGAFGEQRDSVRADVPSATITAVGGHDHDIAAVHAFRQQPSTRARSVAFAVLVSTTILAAWAFERLRFVRARRVLTLRIVGLPPGRAPPALRIA